MFDAPNDPLWCLATVVVAVVTELSLAECRQSGALYSPVQLKAVQVAHLRLYYTVDTRVLHTAHDPREWLATTSLLLLQYRQCLIMTSRYFSPHETRVVLLCRD